MPTSSKSAFDVKLSADLRDQLERRLVEEIRTAKTARSTVMDDGGLIDFGYDLYLQRPMKGISRDTNRYGGADLTSPIWTENVDALSARATRNIFKQEPLWIVEGIGEESAQKEPVVEAFMQFRQESIRLQKVAKRAVTASLVEYGSVLEVCEDAERCVKREVVKAAIATSPEDGSMLLDATTGTPQPVIDEATGEPIPAPEGSDGHVEVKRVWTDYKRRGAYVRRRSMKDFVFLPSHAEDEREVWGHANRFWLSIGEIKRRMGDGEFDKEAVERLGQDNHERQQTTEADRSNVIVTYTPGNDSAEKELWRIQCWLDVKGDGELCFYTAIVSELHGCVLSLKYDWLQRFRTVYLNPFPCPYSVYGLSMTLDKLLTTGEEHTAWRNMNADRGTLKANAPLKRLHGAQWDPTIQPFGMGQVIDVANMNEIQPFEFEDVTAQAMTKENQCVTDANRIIGMNDLGFAQLSEQSRTLGENQMASQQSFVRTDDPISNIEEALEEVGELIHAIEVQTLKDMADGMPAPPAVTQQIKYADDSFNGVFTADMIAGQYRFKPRGSTDEADPQRRTQRREAGIMRMLNLAKVNQFIAQRMASPEFADAMMQDIVDDMKPRNKAAFLKPLPPPMLPGMPMEGQPMPGQGAAPPFGQAILGDLLKNLPAAGGVQ